ncbi:phytoene/squalene synthase family protein [Govanella unica]|uniref:Squalene/phytoene synthase family protein n=1 Tax=Govanella unica TaxID=2975056 RepID=A0A9X3TXU5_9PROT|nr:phytoene/squalene synthase family protein [Govania unica]MDA5193955.1 squalene/phytoene synthase family protein [Govania unica]
MTVDQTLADRLREEDRDRYLTALFAPAGLRPALHALYGFNLDIARIAVLVSEPMIGEIRLAWWREAIEGIYTGSVRHHEVIEALAPVIARHDLPQAAFERMIDARTAELEAVPFASLAELEEYAGASAAPLMDLAARVLGWQAPETLVTAAGATWALAGNLRAVGFHAGSGKVMLPRDLLLAHGIDAHDLVEGRAGADVRAVVKLVADRAEELLRAFRAEARTIPPAARPAFLPVALAAADLRTLAAVEYDPFAPALTAPRPTRLAGLMWRGLRGW